MDAGPPAHEGLRLEACPKRIDDGPHDFSNFLLVRQSEDGSCQRKKGGNVLKGPHGCQFETKPPLAQAHLIEAVMAAYLNFLNLGPDVILTPA